MRDKAQAIALAIRMTKKDKIQYYVVQNVDCACYDIVVKVGIRGRVIIYPTIHENNK